MNYIFIFFLFHLMFQVLFEAQLPSSLTNQIYLIELVAKIRIIRRNWNYDSNSHKVATGPWTLETRV